MVGPASWRELRGSVSPWQMPHEGDQQEFFPICCAQDMEGGRDALRVIGTDGTAERGREEGA